MTTDSMKTLLEKLRVMLKNSGPIDAELKELLQKLDDDILQLLSQQPAGPIVGNTSGNAIGSELMTRAQKISAHLAVRHPHLEPVLREVADTLTNMGI